MHATWNYPGKKRRAIHGLRSSLSILKLSQIIKNESETKLHRTKKSFCRNKVGCPECRARLGLILPDHISNHENRWLPRFIFNAYKAMQPYNNGCSQTRPFLGGIGGCMGLQYMTGWCIGCASVNSNTIPLPPALRSHRCFSWAD